MLHVPEHPPHLPGDPLRLGLYGWKVGQLTQWLTLRHVDEWVTMGDVMTHCVTWCDVMTHGFTGGHVVLVGGW